MSKLNSKKTEIECFFCKIVDKQMPCNLIAENVYAMAFLDIFPASNGHTLVIPKKHYIDLMSCDKMYLNEVINLTKEVTLKIDHSSLKPWGYNYLSNQGVIAGQTVNHFHIHIIPKYAKEEGFVLTQGKKVLDDIEVNLKKILKSKYKI